MKNIITLEDNFEAFYLHLKTKQKRFINDFWQANPPNKENHKELTETVVNLWTIEENRIRESFNKKQPKP